MMSSPSEAEAVAIAQAEIEKQETKVKEAEAKVEKAKGEVQQAETKVEKAEAKVDKAKKEVKEAIEEVKVAHTGGSELEKEAQKGLDSAQKGLDSAQKGLDSAQKGLDSAQKGLDSAQEGVKTAQRLWNIAVASLERASGAEGGYEAASGQGGSSKSGKESGHDSVSSDLERAFEFRAQRKIKVVLWGMFQHCAFASSNDDFLCTRDVDGVEFDFLSHLRVHRELSVAKSPGDDFQIVGGTLEDWLDKLKRSYMTPHSSSVVSADATVDLTPTKPGSATDATHYVVCETKVCKGKNSVRPRLTQLEVRVKLLVERAKRRGVQGAEWVVALAGIGVPRSDAFSARTVGNMLKGDQGNFPHLACLHKHHRVFIIIIETVAERLELLEQAQAQAQEEQRQAQEEQRQALGRLEKQQQELASKLDFFLG